MNDPLQDILDQLPEYEAEPYGRSIRHRVQGRTFLYSDPDSTRLIVKLEPEEAAAVSAYDDRIKPWDNNLGRDHGWVVITLSLDIDDAGWMEVAGWIETSYCQVAPKTLLSTQADHPNSQDPS